MPDALLTQLTPLAQAQLHTLCASVHAPRMHLSATTVQVLVSPAAKPQHAQIMLRPRPNHPPCLDTLRRLGTTCIINGRLRLTSLRPPHQERWDVLAGLGPSHWGVHEPMLHRSLSQDPLFAALYRELRGLYRSALTRPGRAGAVDLGVERLPAQPLSPEVVWTLTQVCRLPPGPYTLQVHHRAGASVHAHWLRVYSAQGDQMPLDPAQVDASGSPEIWVPDLQGGASLLREHCGSAAGQDALSRLLVHRRDLRVGLQGRRTTTPTTDCLSAFQVT